MFSVTPSRDHVFHVTFPAEWKTSDLQQLFGPFGKYSYFFTFMGRGQDASALVPSETSPISRVNFLEIPSY